MSALLAQLSQDTTRASNETDEQYDRRLEATLRTLSSVKILGNAAQPQLLQHLDPARHTLGYMTVLHALTHPDGTPAPFEVLPLITQFLAEADPVQLRYVGSSWRQLIEWTARMVEETRDADLLIALRNGIVRMDPTLATMTSNHLLFVQTCLALRLPRQALPLLDRDVLGLPRGSSNSSCTASQTYPCSHHELSCVYITQSSKISDALTVQDVQEYHLLGANIYMSLQNYSRADLFLRLVLEVPSSHTSIGTLNVEAYKKLQLVSLLHGDTLHRPLEQQGETTKERTLSDLSRPYETLADAFKKRDLKRYQAERSVAGDLWRQDGNEGLVDETSRALTRFRVRDLACVYTTLPLERVASTIDSSPVETEELLMQMIRNDELAARLITTTETGQSILQFHTEKLIPSSSSSSGTSGVNTTVSSNGSQEQQRHLTDRIASLELLSRHIRETDRRIEMSQDFRDHVRKHKNVLAGSATPDPAGNAGMALMGALGGPGGTSGLSGLSGLGGMGGLGEAGGLDVYDTQNSYDAGYEEDAMTFEMGDDEDLMAG